jgi:hypothetical protein
MEQLGAGSWAERVETLLASGARARRVSRPTGYATTVALSSAIQWNPGEQSCVCAGKKARVLLVPVVSAALTGAVAGFLLLGPGGEAPPKPQNTIEQALTRFVADRFGVGYVGRCPGSSRRTATSIGVCAPRGSLARTAASCIAWANL